MAQNNRGSRPKTQSELAVALEDYYRRRRSVSDAALADWERDEAFMALAHALWPVDCEGAKQGGYPAQSARQRLRMRHEGFSALTQARVCIEAFAVAAQAALGALSPPTPGASASAKPAKKKTSKRRKL